MKDNGGCKPVCAVKGMLAGGRAVCGRVINAKYCGSSDACVHKVDRDALKDATGAVMVCPIGVAIVDSN